MTNGKKRMGRGIGILLVLVLLCGILQGGGEWFGVAAAQEEGGTLGDDAPDGQGKVRVSNAYSGETYDAESLEDAFARTGEIQGDSGEIHITLLADMELQSSIRVNKCSITYLELNGHTIVSKLKDGAAFEVDSDSGVFSVQGSGAIQTMDTAFLVSGGELSISENVFVFAQGNTGIQVTGGCAKLIGGYVSARQTALHVKDPGDASLESGTLRVVSGSAIDAGGKSEENCLQDFLFLASGYKDENGQWIALAEGQKNIAGYCSIGNGTNFHPTVTIKLTGLAEGGLVYDGQEKTPEAAVFVQGIPLGAGDYDVSYVENVNVGTAKVLVSCYGIFAPAAAKETFPILPAIPKIAWSCEEVTECYTGQPIKLAQDCLAVTLQNGENFAEVYKNPVVYEYLPAGGTTYTRGLPTNAGTYQVKAGILAEGNYTDAETTTDLRLVIEKMAMPLPAPEGLLCVPYRHKTLGTVELPENWEWQDTTIPLEVELPVEGKAVYVGADQGNYLQEEVIVKVIREECLHGQTKRLNVRDADCENAGYTGDLVCVECGSKREIGEEIPALGHDYDSEVTKQPSTSKEGIRIYTCVRCQHSYEEKIDRLPQTPGGGPSVNPTEPVSTPNPEPTDEPGDATPEPTPTDEPGDATPEPTPTDEPGDATPEPTPTDEPGDATPEPTPTDEPGDATPEPTPTDEPGSLIPKPTPVIQNPDYNNEDTGAPKRGEPFIRTDEDGNIKKGWDVIIEEAGRAGDGSSIVVDMNGAAVVPKDVLESIRDRDVTIVLDLGNGISWSISGEDITADKLGDIDFSVQMGSNTIPVDVINTITGERYTIQVSLAYDGEFGLMATLTVALGSENAGYNASLYYYNPETEALEFITVVEIREDGTASWKFSHASDYVIVVWEEKEEGHSGMPKDPSGEQDASGSKLPDTSMAWKGSWFFWIGMLFVSAGFGLLFLGRGKKGRIQKK